MSGTIPSMKMCLLNYYLFVMNYNLQSVQLIPKMSNFQIIFTLCFSIPFANAQETYIFLAHTKKLR